MSKATQANIKKLLSLTGTTHKQLADIANVDRTAVSHWVHGKAEPRMGSIQLIADHFGIRKSNIIETGGMDTVERGVDGRLYDSAMRGRGPADGSGAPIGFIRMPARSRDNAEKIERLYAAVVDTLLDADESMLIEMYRSLDEEGRRLAMATMSAFAASHSADS